MPQPPDWKRYLEAGMQFTEMRRSQARALAGDLVSTGQLARDQVAAAVDEMVAMSRRRTEELQDVVRAEVQRQLGSLGLATQADLRRLERKLNARPRSQEAAKQAREARRDGRTKASARRRQEGRREEGGLTTLVRRRLDAELVRRGLASSRAVRGRSGRAPDACSVAGAPATSPARQVATDEPIAVAGARRPVRVAGRPQARGGARRVRHRRARAGAASTSARRPAGSPTACCSAVPPTWSRSTSGAGSSRGRCATTIASR